MDLSILLKLHFPPFFVTPAPQFLCDFIPDDMSIRWICMQSYAGSLGYICQVAQDHAFMTLRNRCRYLCVTANAINKVVQMEQIRIATDQLKAYLRDKLDT